jgi:hypothetical protein
MQKQERNMEDPVRVAALLRQLGIVTEAILHYWDIEQLWTRYFTIGAQGDVIDEYMIYNW